MPIRVVGEIPDLSGVPREIKKKALRQSVNILRRYARQEAPRGKTGKLRSKMQTSVSPGKGEAKVKATAKHAHLVHEGTKGHWIPRKGKKGVRINGVWRRRVWHPGAKANRFMNRALDRGQPEVDHIMAKIGDEELGAAAR